jgi:heme-degrading monooxygenase HmoA
VAVLMVFEVPGGTVEQYEQMNEIMGIRGDEDAPDGLISHVVGRTDDGVLVADVWESDEQLRRFFEERLGAALKEVGMPESAHPRILPVHNLIARGAGAEAGTIVVLDIEGFGTDTYDEMVKSMPAHDSTHPAFSHAAAADGDGMVIVDVWGSPEEFGRFAQNEVGPAAARAGMSAPIEPRFVPVFNTMRGAAAH